MMEERRNIRVFEQITSMLKRAPRKMAFRWGMDFTTWHTGFQAKIRDLLGPVPANVILNARVLDEELVDEFEEDGISPFKRQRIVYDTDEHSSCIAYLLIPADLKDGEKRPAILNAHGHGAGKVKLATGMDRSSWVPGLDIPGPEAASIHLVKYGFVVLAPDWRVFGDRCLDHQFARPNRDPCNVAYLALKYFGYNLLALNVADAMRSIDLLQAQPMVDPERIGMVGKSYGGTMTTYVTAMDDRVKVACISGYLSTLDDALSMRGLGNTCGAQFLPNLLEWGDIPDVVGLIAPRPLLIEAGTEDDCFVFDDATKAYEHLVQIYRASGHPENLERDTATVGHAYIFNKLPKFFRKHL